MRLSYGLMLKRRLLLAVKCLPLLFICSMLVWYRIKSPETNLVDEVNIDEQPSTQSIPFSLDIVADLINKSNQRQFILNEEKFGPLRGNDVIIIIQVHDRLQYLNALVKSLSTVRGIDKTLVIFSHDQFDVRINSLIQSIDFCKVLQIFYPTSIQLHPNVFPGEDPLDCPRDAKKEEAIKLKCQNAQFPDSYGHYREAKYTQTKHHWFWKANFVFDGLQVTRNHSGLYIFLEEDYYVAKDMLYMTAMMDTFRKSSCSECTMMTLGVYAKSVNFGRDGNKVERHQWVSSKHNMGMVFDRHLWSLVKNCSEEFCRYDDYNWDWSLQHISNKCLPKPIKTLVVSSPRVFHVGECGVHHKGKKCYDNGHIEKVENSLNASSKFLFPAQLSLKPVMVKVIKQPRNNGGWGDHRDHDLCLKHLI
ncbi:Alpha-1,6-mannosyl-glycoprotein 2-beta-N-acetylglucosaminyltransferase [Halotydeus destructor]|nr:Alpha-1,6-mannosyl-glycoprotein 2-beta-N-acetylglucosaminyltransferase [Halotydeus destructor]